MKASELSALLDRYDEVKQDRLDLDRQSRILNEEEKNLREQIIVAMQQEKLTAAGGNRVQVTLEYENIGVVNDWPAVFNYIAEEGAYDLMYRRLNQKALRERMEDGVKVPGVGVIPQPKLSESRAKLKK